MTGSRSTFEIERAQLAAKRQAKRSPDSGQITFDDYRWRYTHAFPLLDVSEVAELFNVSEQTVREMADEGRFLSFAINVEATPQREHLRVVRATCGTNLRDLALADWTRIYQTADEWLLRATSCGAQRQVTTVKEAAMALRCFPTHVRALVDARELMPVYVSPSGSTREHLRIVRASLVEFVQRRITLKFGTL